MESCPQCRVALDRNGCCPSCRKAITEEAKALVARAMALPVTPADLRPVSPEETELDRQLEAQLEESERQRRADELAAGFENGVPRDASGQIDFAAMQTSLHRPSGRPPVGSKSRRTLWTSCPRLPALAQQALSFTIAPDARVSRGDSSLAAGPKAQQSCRPSDGRAYRLAKLGGGRGSQPGPLDPHQARPWCRIAV